MNAARRKISAIDKLEEHRTIILEHILKLSTLSKDNAVNHWQKELNAFASRLRKFNKAKAHGKQNYSKDLLFEYLWEDQLCELPLSFVEDYGLHEIYINWDDVKAKIQAFIEQVLQE